MTWTPPFPESHLLQRILPATAEVLEPPLYVRPGEGIESYDTYFGVFHAARWRRKTSVGELHVAVQVDGPAEVEIVAVKRMSEKVVESARVSSAGTVSIRLVELSDTNVDTYYARVRGARLVQGGWYAANAPLRDVRLNACITTFNRQPYVTANVERLRRLGREVPSLGDSFRVTIVDNGRNLELPAGDGVAVRVIPNPNLGGAGGFARGLMHARQDGWTTHVLFMDDDITMEVESVVRAIALFRYATDPRLCVHGAMISEEIPWMQFEAGSHYAWRYTYPLRAVGREDDLRDRITVLADEPESRFEYTAWWFTAFPIAVG
ncbi:MAG: glycosyltransferase, partial [Actinobacteria bacterium]|nr:glycosyltransferase [Actinomycetota bacterium]